MAQGLVNNGGVIDNKVYLYKDGVTNTSLIGSFIFVGNGCGYLTTTIQTLTSNDFNNYSITTSNTITGSYTKLCIEFKFINPYAVNNGYHKVSFGATNKYLGITKIDNTTLSTNQVITQCVDYISGTTVAISGYNLKAEIQKIWLE